MQTYCLVRPEHLNHHGYLFGGQLLRWADEFAWLAASKDFTGKVLVTRAMDSSEFRKRVVNGAILRFSIEQKKLGESSVTYSVEVYADEPGSRVEVAVFCTCVTFVAVDEQGRKTRLTGRPRL
ncbi:MAG: acyl-CoA thioesterase [Chitinispirillaceae bacterium]